MESEWVSVAVLAAGLALLLNPLVPGVHLGSDAVYEYSAVSVEYESGTGLELRGVDDGAEKEPLPVDDEIACEAHWNRWTCGVFGAVQRNGPVPGGASAGVDFHAEFRLVALGDRFFRPTTVDRAGEAQLALEPVTDSDPLRMVATSDLRPRERRAVESGRIVTYRLLARTNQLLQFDGGYYFVHRTGHKEYGGERTHCVASGGDFCSDADWKRRTDSTVTLGSRLAGLLLTFRGWERIRS
ncbi:hypothetical protein [Halorussus marinus]|uniref:hypothetical protein n=1 Tax=Halorussus marinus TaxID=2505976 RepID=UPI00106EF4C6|nr:hypothetical protein [Halorussus marinus]